jgi:hypothetical protein
MLVDSAFMGQSLEIAWSLVFKLVASLTEKSFTEGKLSGKTRVVLVR